MDIKKEMLQKYQDELPNPDEFPGETILLDDVTPEGFIKVGFQKVKKEDAENYTWEYIATV